MKDMANTYIEHSIVINNDAEYKLIATITTENKDDQKIKMFPNINIGFDQLFDCID